MTGEPHTKSKLNVRGSKNLKVAGIITSGGIKLEIFLNHLCAYFFITCDHDEQRLEIHDDLGPAKNHQAETSLKDGLYRYSGTYIARMTLGPLRGQYRLLVSHDNYKILKPMGCCLILLNKAAE